MQHLPQPTNLQRCRPLFLPNAHHFLSLKLTDTNYLFWKTQITPYLRGQHLLRPRRRHQSMSPSTILCGDVTVPNPDFQSWFDQDQLLMSLLISSLTEDVLPLIVGATSSREIWTTLESALASPSHTRILQLHLQIQNIKQGELSVTQFLQKAKRLSDELSAAGRPLSLQDFNLYIFKGLNSIFRDLVTTLASRPTPIPYSELHSMLLSHELMHSVGFASLTVSDSLEPSPQVNFVQRNTLSNNGYRGRGGNGKGRGKGRGRNHGYRPNDSRQPTYSFGDQRYQSHDAHPRCQICNGLNHTAMFCNQRYNHTSAPSAHLATSTNFSDSLGDWFPDTGATHHATPALSTLSHHTDYHGSDQLRVGNGNGLPISNIGKTTLHTPSSSFHLFNVLHVPSLTKSLLSVSQFSKDNRVYFEFHPSHFFIKDQVTQKILLRGETESGLYKLSSSPPVSPSAFLSEKIDSVCWHRRLGHPHLRVLRQILAQNKLPCSSNKQPTICHACQLGKSCRLSLPVTKSISNAPLDLIFSDVWGSSPGAIY